ncbi:hypothetical protein EKQ61_04420 [Staphylococcus gallinarum]|uniref:Uncharacterized protein n=1 Tax=Staphylococcus gallinarum TaxID=1293 RepID=A0A0D0SF47_STAGA|nr:hypothetical protein [Staphylococcus gallinarum]KIR10895.1 hypothetical protein SH09_10610 [Staphylococcus gallinarum]RTX80309.1 hypothetical protein EKQ61_04420 [Staphylococcus gallinarum]GEQ06603.1 hypothetical protein SGA02_24310 [Staphylococcus gallinarum]SUQ38596.1 Uncharacterised protein [Staphylococcus gallinarum]
MAINDRFENIFKNLDAYYKSKIEFNDLITGNLPEVDLLNISESKLSDHLMDALITIDIFTKIKEFNNKQLGIYEKILTDVYHIIEMIDLNAREQEKILAFQKELLLRRRKAKELNNVLNLLPKRPGDTQERLNKLSLVERRKTKLQYSLRSKNVFGDVIEDTKKLGIYKGNFIETSRIKMLQKDESYISRQYIKLLEAILEDNGEGDSNQNVRTKILNFIRKDKS